MHLALALAVLALAVPARASAPIVMTGTVAFTPEDGALAADLHVEIPVADAASPLVFFFNAGLEVTTLRGDGLDGFSREPMQGNPAWTLLHIEFDAEAAGDVLALDLAYSGVPVMFGSGINQVSADWIELSADSAWHPLMTTLLQPIRYDLLLDLPDDWTVVAAGRAEREAEGVRLVSRVDAPDVPFTASPSLERTGDDAVAVYHRGLDADLAALVIDRAAACRDWLDARFPVGGPLPPLSFTVPERTVSGYARGNYIALTNLDGISERSLTEFLCHELAHHWSVGAAPMTVDNWLNEGFAVLIAAHAVRDLYGDEAYARVVAGWARDAAGAGPIWTEADQARRWADAASYDKAPLLLHLLEQRIGADAFGDLLTRYAHQPINATPELLAAVEAVAGAETRAWFVERLADEGDLSL